MVSPPPPTITNNEAALEPGGAALEPPKTAALAPWPLCKPPPATSAQGGLYSLRQPKEHHLQLAAQQRPGLQAGAVRQAHERTGTPAPDWGPPSLPRSGPPSARRFTCPTPASHRGRTTCRSSTLLTHWSAARPARQQRSLWATPTAAPPAATQSWTRRRSTPDRWLSTSCRDLTFRAQPPTRPPTTTLVIKDSKDARTSGTHFRTSPASLAGRCPTTATMRSMVSATAARLAFLQPQTTTSGLLRVLL